MVVLIDPGIPLDVEGELALLQDHEPAGGRTTALFIGLSPSFVSGAAANLAANADDVVCLPCRPDELILRYRTWRIRQDACGDTVRPGLRLRTLNSTVHAMGIIGTSPPMRTVLDLVQRIGPTESSVLIRGETGTGKELVARALHTLSARRERPFVSVNLSAIPESLVESELFGHVAGAYTGARVNRVGRLEAADGGTLFLDEIGDVPLSLQVKLLRVLQEKCFEPVGSNRTKDADFRVICATHRDLEARVHEGEFREDLYYRINVVSVDMPPLRDRREDVTLLARHFLALFGKRYGMHGATLTPAALEALREHQWPGNVRELEHTIERAVVLSRSTEGIGADLLQPRPVRQNLRAVARAQIEDGRGLAQVLGDLERTILAETMRRYGGNQSVAAKKLKIPRQTLQSRLRRLGL
jgi:transcriptional regulator with PAS, ATPase and Fis domain